MEQESVLVMWNNYLSSINENEETTKKRYTSWHFCDNEEDANALAELVRIGTKRATASLFLSYEFENEELPKEGNLSVIIDWSGTAVCIIETINIEIIPYNKVSEEFAETEGEGDKSLNYWRRTHWSYFSREMEGMGKRASEDMLVVCERFQVVYLK